MSFLAPWFLLGGLAVALPIIFHLIRRSPKEELPFSSLMFLQPTLPRVTKRNRIEHLLLLLLRCLVVCLLAAAFARPFLQKARLFSERGGGGRKLIILVDTSASMRRTALWDAALAQARRVLNTATPADQVAVYTFDRQVRALVSFHDWATSNPSERIALASKRLADLKPGWEATQLGPALLTAAEAFAEADKQGQNIGARRLIVITDLQEGSRLDGLQGYDWPRGIEVQIQRVQTQRPTNAGLQWIAEAETVPLEVSELGGRIRVSNSADAKREQFQLRWEGVAGVPTAEIYVPPGQSRIVAAPKLPQGVIGEHLVLTGDDESYDNHLYLLAPRPAQATVWFLGNAPESDPTRPLYYLRRAFQETRREVVRLVSRPGSAPLAAGELAGARLAILEGAPGAAQSDSVGAYINGGGTALLLLDTPGAGPAIGQLAGLSGVRASELAPTNYAMFGQIDFGHPIFAPFADPRYSDFTKIHFWKYRRLEFDSKPGARVVAQFDNGDPALVEVSQGKGRLLVLTSGWQPTESQLALSSKFVPLLYALLELGGGGTAQVTQFHVGEAISLRAVIGLADPPPLTVRKPDGQKVTLPTGVTDFQEADQPGIYSVNAGPTAARFAVNLDPAESRTAPLPIDQLERLGIPLKPREMPSSEAVAQQRRLQNAELENQQKLWRWLTMVAFGLLLVETGLAAWLTQRPKVQPEGTA